MKGLGNTGRSEYPFLQWFFALCTGRPRVENLGNVLGNRTQALRQHLKKQDHQTSSVSLGIGQR